MPGVPGFPPGASWGGSGRIVLRAEAAAPFWRHARPHRFAGHARPHHKKPPAGAGGHRVGCDPVCHACGRYGAVCGTFGAWLTGWFSCPESPGFHPGLLGADAAATFWGMRGRIDLRGMRGRITKSPRREPGDTGSDAIPCAMHVGVTERCVGRLEHGRRGGFHARSPRVSTRGFLGRKRPHRFGGIRGRTVLRGMRGRITKSPRREPGDSTARDRRSRRRHDGDVTPGRRGGRCRRACGGRRARAAARSRTSRPGRRAPWDRRRPSGGW